MPVFRRDERPSLGRRLSELATAVGILALVAGLVTAFVVVGIYVLHATLPRNQERRTAPPVAVAPQEAVAPTPAPPPAPKRPASQEIAVAAPPPAPPPPPPKTYAPPRDPARMDAEGFVRYWLVLGPVKNERPLAGGPEIDPARVPGEAALRPTADETLSVKGRSYKWKRYRAGDFPIDFRHAIEGGGDDTWAYAATYVVSPEERRDVRLYVGSNDQVRVYLNGQSVLAHDKTRSLKKDDMVATGLTLKKGHNTVLMKVVNEKNAWQACLRFGDAHGTPMTDLQVTTTRD